MQKIAEFLERDGSKLNALGGLMSANPGFAAGLYRILAVSRQLQEVSGPGALGLAHGINGPLGQSHCVWVLEAGGSS